MINTIVLIYIVFTTFIASGQVIVPTQAAGAMMSLTPNLGVNTAGFLITGVTGTHKPPKYVGSSNSNEVSNSDQNLITLLKNVVKRISSNKLDVDDSYFDLSNPTVFIVRRSSQDGSFE